MAAILSFLFQYFQERCQDIAVAGLMVIFRIMRGETGHRLGSYRGQLELAAQLADAFLNHATVHHPHIPATKLGTRELG